MAPTRAIAVPLLRGWALACVLALSGRAQAAPQEGQRASSAEVAAAQALFEQGRALVSKGRAREACPKFEQSQRLDPALGTELNLAKCYEQLGKLASAHALYTKVAAAAQATGQGQREEVAQARADALQPRLTKLVIFVPTSSAGKLRVERDGLEVGEAEWGRPVPVDPGVHHVRALSAGVLVWEIDLDVPSDGAVHELTVPQVVDAPVADLPVAEQGDGFSRPLNHKLALVAAGVGVVGLGMGSYFAVRAVSQKNAADDAGCRDRVCPTQQGVDLRASASNAGDLATVGACIGVAGLATSAALLWFLPDLDSDPRNESARLTLTPVVSPAVSGLFLDAQF